MMFRRKKKGDGPAETPAAESRPEPVKPAKGPKQPGRLAAVGRMDVYTTMLLIALVAMIVAAGLYFLELARYSFETSPPGL